MNGPICADCAAAGRYGSRRVDLNAWSGLPAAAPVQPRDWLAIGYPGHASSSTARTCPAASRTPSAVDEDQAATEPSAGHRRRVQLIRESRNPGPSLGRLGRHRAVKHHLAMTKNDHRRPNIEPAQSLDHGSELVGDGRVDLYAGFCDRHARRRTGGGHPSRPAVAGRLQRPTRRHRAGSPRASARVVILR